MRDWIRLDWIEYWESGAPPIRRESILVAARRRQVVHLSIKIRILMVKLILKGLKGLSGDTDEVS